MLNNSLSLVLLTNPLMLVNLTYLSLKVVPNLIAGGLYHLLFNGAAIASYFVSDRLIW